MAREGMSFGASIYKTAAEEPAVTFRDVARKLSALPGGLDFTGTPEGLPRPARLTAPLPM